MKRLLFTRLAIVALGFISLTSCENENAEDLFPCEEIISVSYENDIAPIISQNCSVAGCHVDGGLKEDVQFDSYQRLMVKVNEGSFRNRVVEQMSMPPSGLPDCDVERIKIWLSEGAQNN